MPVGQENAIRYLDIDLDAFVTPIAHWPHGGRLGESDYTPWSEHGVRQFLELQCGLSKHTPLPGVFFEHHDEIYSHLGEEFERSGGIDLVHVNAHADLGLGDASWVYMHSKYLQLPIHARGLPTRGPKALNAGSWLAFAIAKGWISDLTYVHAGKTVSDLHPIYMECCNNSATKLQMKQFDRSLLDHSTIDYEKLLRTKPLAVDAPVQFNRAHIKTFRSANSFQAASLCRSPSYTPKSADLLIPVINEYITLCL